MRRRNSPDTSPAEVAKLFGISEREACKLTRSKGTDAMDAGLGPRLRDGRLEGLRRGRGFRGPILRPHTAPAKNINGNTNGPLRQCFSQMIFAKDSDVA